MKPIKRIAQIVFSDVCWTDNNMHSMSARIMESGKILPDIVFTSRIQNVRAAKNDIWAQIKKWNHGRFFFSNLSFGQINRDKITNDKRALGQQRVAVNSMPNVTQKANQVRSGYRASNGKVYLAVEKMQGNQIRHSNTGLRYDNPFYQQTETKSKYASNYQQPDAYKWDRIPNTYTHGGAN